MDGVITKQSEEYIMMMEMLKKCSKEIFAIQDLPVPIANEVYMTGEQVCGMLHISSRTLQTPLGDIQNQTDFLGIHSFFLFNRSKFLFNGFNLCG